VVALLLLRPGVLLSIRADDERGLAKHASVLSTDRGQRGEQYGHGDWIGAIHAP